jgi:6-phosphogluconolactonase
MAENVILYIGTYTVSASNDNQNLGKGIYTYNFNSATGELTYRGETRGVENPSYLVIDQQQRHLYATSEVSGREEDSLYAYAIDPTTFELTYLNHQSTLGQLNAHVALDRTGKYAFASNYLAGKSTAVLPILPDGSLGPAVHSVEHHGSGPVLPNQEKSRAHFASTDPSNRYLYVVDLGIDKIMIYKFDSTTGTLTPNEIPSADLPPGSGSRHMVFHPNGKFAYVINELNSTVTVMAYDSANGSLPILQTISTLPDGFAGTSYCAAIRLSPSGKFLYGSNRGHDSIVIFAIDQTNGQLTLVGHHPTGGKWPRDFVIDPTGTFLVTLNQHSHDVYSYRINQDTGQLDETGYSVNVPTPVCLTMMQV